MVELIDNKRAVCQVAALRIIVWFITNVCVCVCVFLGKITRFNFVSLQNILIHDIYFFFHCECTNTIYYQQKFAKLPSTSPDKLQSSMGRIHSCAQRQWHMYIIVQSVKSHEMENRHLRNLYLLCNNIHDNLILFSFHYLKCDIFIILELFFIFLKKYKRLMGNVISS